MSAISWAFNPGGSGEQFANDVRRLTQVEAFDLAVVLGSGWSDAAHLGETLAVFEYGDWPCFPAGQISGHAGQLIAVQYSSLKILFFSLHPTLILVII